MAPRAVWKCAAALGGVPLGAPVGAVVLLVAGVARPRGLMGRVMVMPSTAPSYEASYPGSYTPPKMDSHCGMHSNLRPERCKLHPPFFLPVEEAQFLMGPPHQGTARARKNFSLRQVPGTNWFGDGGSFWSFHQPTPTPPPHTSGLMKEPPTQECQRDRFCEARVQH